MRAIAPGQSSADASRTHEPGPLVASRRRSLSAWLYNVARRGRVFTFEEYAAMLAEAGFGPARRLEGAPWLQAERTE
jgi:hypothetical protein